MIKFALIECDNLDEFNRCVTELEKKFGSNKSGIIPSAFGEVSGQVFEKMMLEKGYKVSSQRAKAARCAMFNIQRTIRGNEWWYNLQDIERVPPKL